MIFFHFDGGVILATTDQFFCEMKILDLHTQYSFFVLNRFQRDREFFPSESNLGRSIFINGSPGV
jgi:hypothetical protein